LFKYLKIYSIDVALGAVVSAWFFGKVILVDIPWFIYLIIALTVWSIYTADHLVDAKKLGSRQGPDRYLYHRKYFNPALAFVIGAIVASLLMAAFLLPYELLINGFILGSVVIIYFLLRLLIPSVFAGLKELIAAIVYTAGVALPAYFYMYSFSFYFIVAGLQFFCLVFANLLICAIWDESWDKLHSYNSMAVAFGKKFIKVIISSLIAISALSAAIGIFIYSGHALKIQLIILLMNGGLILAYYFGQKMKEHTQRLVIDSIFFIPLLLPLL
jgi:hypothetical protein